MLGRFVRHSSSRRLRLSLVVAYVAATGACGKTNEIPIAPLSVDSASVPQNIVFKRDAIYDWNARAMYFAYLMGGTEPVATTYEALIYGMVNGAIHDAVNSIVPRYKNVAYTFGYVARTVDDFSTDATIATAAFTVLESIGLRLANDGSIGNPYPLDWVRRQYKGEMDLIPNSPAKQAGISLGRDIGATMLALHPFTWTTANGLASYSGTGLPGEYRPTEPRFSSAPGTSGVAAWANWAGAGRFALTVPNQFRAPPPYGTASRAEAVRTAAYAADFNEVKRLGGARSERTSEQTSIALFWYESPPEIWLRVARATAIAHDLDAWDTARLFALVSFAVADANVVAYDTKYAFPFWRPVSAIRAGDADGNPDTESDAEWDVATAQYDIATPPSPEYSSASSITAGAAASIIQSLVSGSTAFSLRSGVVPDLERAFASIAAAEQECADAQVYLGYHFRQSSVAGVQQGRALGRFIVTTMLSRIR